MKYILFEIEDEYNQQTIVGLNTNCAECLVYKKCLSFSSTSDDFISFGLCRECINDMFDVGQGRGEF